jgi:hypothetical protein
VSSASSFRIPAALDAAGRLVVPSNAHKGCDYLCPACEGRVDLHAGARKAWHFHHRASACTQESVLHLCAKRFVAAAVQGWRDGGPSPVFVRRCAEPRRACEAECRQRLPAKVAEVALEHRMPSGHVVDVALLARGAGGALLPLPVAVIEILHTHAVDATKARELGVPWVEVEAAQVCATEGRELVCVTDRFVPWLCAEHAGARGQARRERQAERATAASLVRRLPFRLAEFPGLSVVRVTVCPRGHDALVFGWEGKDPPWPRPPVVVAVQNDFDYTVRAGAARPTKTAAFRRSYGSACAVCGELLAASVPPPGRRSPRP